MKNGFSLIELMMAILVLSIVISLGAPSFSGSIQNNRIKSQSNAMNGAISFVRTEAVKRNSSVSMCASSNQSSCTGNWEQGWIIFDDPDGSGSLTGGETILKIGETLAGENTLRLTGSSTSSITFDNQGRTTSSSTFTFCDDREEAKAIGIVINVSGQTRRAVDEDGNNIVNGHNGDIACP
ncbi:MAG: GspH/FimT family pseudopilin [Pseudomonadales bacterium]|nr:GspH/FimT family pseudopilin [Pseudomonadales bacterium]